FNKKKDFLDVRVYRHFGLKRPEKSTSTPVFYFAGRERHPAMLQGRMGDGLVLLAAFPVHPRWGNLPLLPEFVPLMLRLVAHCQHHPEAEVSSVVVAEGPAEVALSSSWDQAKALVTAPRDRGNEEKVELRRQGARLLGVYEATTKRGYYAVNATGQRPDRACTAALGFAVNIAPRESQTDLIGKPGLEKLLPSTVKLTYVDT